MWTGRRWRSPTAPRAKRPRFATLVHVRLQLVTDAEVALLRAGQGVDQPPARRTFNQRRFVRWCQEAYDQGGVLTLLDLSLLRGLAESYIGQLRQHYAQEPGLTVPIRGTVHDIGPAVSHKAEVIRRYLRGQSPRTSHGNSTTRNTPCIVTSRTTR